MCFTASSTSDNYGLTDGLRTRLLQKPGPKRTQPNQLPKSRLSSSYAAKSTEISLVAKGGEALKRLQSPLASTNVGKKPDSSLTIAFAKPRLPADVEYMERPVAVTKITSSSDSYKPDLQLHTIDIEPEKPRKKEKTLQISAQFIGKMKTKQVKGMIAGMGKELRRAATTVGDTLSEKIPSKKKSKEKSAAKERQELLAAEPQKPQIRNADEIKKAYGHATDVRHAAGMAHDKLRERGEKLSAMQRRTTELESEAANFSSLAQELVKKMENKKWYEM